MPLDLSKLQNIRAAKDGNQTAGCPACIQEGRDKSRTHLLIYADGRFGCGAVQNDHAHRSRIWALAGDGSKGDGEAPVERAKQLSLPRTYPIGTLERLTKDYSYWESRKISAATVKPFKGGVASIGQMHDRWVFPQFNEQDEVIGFSGRCLRKMSKEDRKKFNRPAWKHLTPSSQFVWGGVEEIDECGRAILVESIGDSLALRECGVPETLCLFGTNLSELVLGKLIALNPREIVIATNNDADHHTGKNVGALFAAKIEKVLLSFFDRRSVRVSLPVGQKDFGKMLEVDMESVVEWRKALDAGVNPGTVE
jgi:hypothetical protein